MSKVEWRDILGFGGDYAVSNTGLVRRNVGYVRCGRKLVLQFSKVLVLSTDKDGYKTVGLRRNGRPVRIAVHTLVLTAFVGPRPPGMQVAHNDGVPDHNALSNLRWATPSENNRDKEQHGTVQRGLNSPRAKLTPDQVLRIKSDGRKGRVIAREYGVTESCISDIRHGSSWAWLEGAKA